MTIKKICFLALLSALLIITKIVLQGIPFLEFVSLLFVIYGLTLSIKENWIIFFIFFIINIAINGFGLYWLPYLIIFPITFTLSYCVRNFRNRYLLASLIAINSGFLIFITYFISDAILFGKTLAIVNGSYAFLFNLLEGLINSLAVFFLGIPLVKIIEFTNRKLFNQLHVKKQFLNKLTKKNIFLIGFLTIIFLSTFSIIPIYLFLNKNLNSNSFKKNASHILRKQKGSQKNASNKCIVKYTTKNIQIVDIPTNCDDLLTFGKYLDSLDSTKWEVNYIINKASDFNLDGKKERFLGAINNYQQKFYTNGMCPLIYVNNTLASVGIDMLDFKNNYLYELIFSSKNC